MDFKRLLRLYIEYVAYCEGVTYIGDVPKEYHWEGTEDEWAQLEAIELDVFPPNPTCFHPEIRNRT